MHRSQIALCSGRTRGNNDNDDHHDDIMRGEERVMKETIAGTLSLIRTVSPNWLLAKRAGSDQSRSSYI